MQYTRPLEHWSRKMRSTYSFDKSVNNKLSQLASKKGTTKSEILRRAIVAYEYLDDQAKDGLLTIEKPDGQKVEVLMP